mmetsp:Transcript_34176/g.41323  ORF Transcript_34176/g.41323 Transcript_34176/m.41323 type:complete len:336 (-) Transcript_34176:209-1216(-)|eukprot:CAMPEP_0197864422 /NCGR_PEP_ID=MMETSP1438-20131217/42668_1 /TAXON_ID=1461541 /ORGANISM="Pterosperma sp., Strain CCMP1384" /LENGTH=335 /DNA_ID=CAMNT_0043482673 /DNA_START=326 /DNA_END=1333 /DNA_ORIENTATION=+
MVKWREQVSDRALYTGAACALAVFSYCKYSSIKALLGAVVGSKRPVAALPLLPYKALPKSRIRQDFDTTIKSECPWLVMMAGWPDTCDSAWGPLTEKFKDEYSILQVCLPGYEDDPKAPVPVWGYSFQELTDMLQATIDQVCGSDKQVTLVMHDWGAYLGYLYQCKYPARVDKIVAMDVGCGFPELTLKNFLYNISYQVPLAAIYASSQLFGDTVGDRLLFNMFWVWIKGHPYLGPCPYDYIPRGLETCKGNMGYPYFRLYLSVLTGTAAYPRYPKCPTLFLHGCNKNAYFHSQKFLDYLAEQPGSTWEQLACGHWVQLHKTDEVTEHMKKFLKA